MNTRRAFLGTLGLFTFSILPGAGRVWRATRETSVIEYRIWSPEWVQVMNDTVLSTGRRTPLSPAESRAFLEAFFYGKRITMRSVR
jgi:hypothetical protein